MKRILIKYKVKYTPVDNWIFTTITVESTSKLLAATNLKNALNKDIFVFDYRIISATVIK